MFSLVVIYWFVRKHSARGFKIGQNLAQPTCDEALLGNLLHSPSILGSMWSSTAYGLEEKEVGWSQPLMPNIFS